MKSEPNLLVRFMDAENLILCIPIDTTVRMVDILTAGRADPQSVRAAIMELIGKDMESSASNSPCHRRSFKPTTVPTIPGSTL
jgi:hypothetical protein